MNGERLTPEMVKDRLDFEAFFRAELGDLRPGGNGNALALCPFHPDRDPSLSVNLASGLFKCFACDAAGDVFTFFQRRYNCDFPTALEALARFAGLNPEGAGPGRGGGGRGGGPGALEATYPYLDASGNLLFEVCRYRTPGGDKTFRQRRPDPEKPGWIWNLKGVPLVPYRLPELLAADPATPVFVAEGERDTDRLAALGLVATCNPGGAGKWRDEYNQYLHGRRVVILPDNDPPGRAHALKVAQALHGVAASVKILDLPGLSEKGDVSDWIDAGHTADELLSLAEATPEWDPRGVAMEEPQDRRRETQAELLIKLAAEAELFHDASHRAYATIPVGGHLETWPVRSHRFRGWLQERFFRAYGKPAGGQALQDAIEVLSARALFDGPELPVFVRVAHLDDRVWVDLADPEWRAVEISPEGWRVVERPPVKFLRKRGLALLPVPEPGGSLGELRPFVNCREEDWPLVAAWLVGALSPGPYPVLVLQGEQGSAKTTTARTLKGLIDPSVAPQRAAPRGERDLMISAANSWVLSFDNLSSLPSWLSDAFCRLATGGGLATRELYSDDAEVLFDAMRPLVLNGIGGLVNRQDLADRAIILDLPPIPDEQRRAERIFWGEFRRAQPRILGALFDAVSAALRNLEGVRLPRLPRLADFASWICAAESALGLGGGAFLRAYYGNRGRIVEMGLEADQVAAALRKFMSERDFWEGTATALLEELEEVTPEQITRGKGWPKAPHILSTRLRRAATFLRAVGIDVSEGRTKGGRSLRISRERSVASVQSAFSQGLSTVTGDASGVSSVTDDASSVTDDASLTEASPRRASIHAGFDAGDAGDAPFPPYSDFKSDEAGPGDEDELRGLFILWGEP